MLFSEIYNCYFNAVAQILKEAVEKKLTGKKVTEIIRKQAFAESIMTIEDALYSEEWPLLTEKLETPIEHVPSQPLTILQKRFMKGLLLDPKIQLFAPDAKGLEDVEPLSRPEMFVYYDRYEDGDPFGEKVYIKNFRICLEAFTKKQGLHVEYNGRTGLPHEITGIPKNFEYSAKDDKFRLKIIPTEGEYKDVIEINMARIVRCSLADVTAKLPERVIEEPKKTVVLELKDERNALTRAMLQFSYLEKETVQMDEERYQITLYYDRKDETEILIQILAFGPTMYVKGPEEFKDKIRQRIERQKCYFLNDLMR